jgi:GT2 family glycosyltransferase
VNHLSRSPHQQPRQVDWLSGCSMSFRASVFEHIRFDERRTGNGVGEDVDFCLRASAYGRILWLSDATLEHHQSPINRFGARKSGYSTIDHRLLLASDRLHTVRRSRVVARGYVESLLRLFRSFVTRSKPQREYALGMLERLCRHVED